VKLFWFYLVTTTPSAIGWATDLNIKFEVHYLKHPLVLKLFYPYKSSYNPYYAIPDSKMISHFCFDCDTTKKEAKNFAEILKDLLKEFKQPLCNLYSNSNEPTYIKGVEEVLSIIFMGGEFI